MEKEAAQNGSKATVPILICWLFVWQDGALTCTIILMYARHVTHVFLKQCHTKFLINNLLQTNNSFFVQTIRARSI